MTPDYDTLILDIDQPIKDFTWQLRTEHRNPAFINDILHTVISCITDLSSAEYDLRNLMNEIAYAEGMYHDGEIEIDQTYAMPVFDLGKKILAHLIDLKAFDESGEMVYEYSSYEHPEFKGTLLKRVKD